jgi:hypothetical protein
MKKRFCSCIVILLLLAPTASFSLTGIDEMDLGQLELQAGIPHCRLKLSSSGQADVTI